MFGFGLRYFVSFGKAEGELKNRKIVIFKCTPNAVKCIGRSLGLPAVAVSAAAAIAAPAWFVDCFVYPKLAAFKFMTVGASNSGCGFFVCTHLDKSKPFGITGFAIEDDLCGGYTAKPGKKGAEVVFCGVVGEVPDIQFLSH